MNVLLVLAVLTPSAPAPRAKPARPISHAEVVGLWQMKWGQCAWQARFSADGHYACWGSGSTWIGTWQLEGNVLTVTERSLDSYAQSTGFVWKAKLTRGRLGTIDGGVTAPGPAVTFQLSQSLLAAR